MLKLVKNQAEGRKVQYANLSILLVSGKSELEQVQQEQPDAILIDAVRPEAADELIASIRLDDQFHLYLKPVFALSSHQNNLNNHIHLDGFSSIENLSELAVKSIQINEKVQQIKNHSEPNEFKQRLQIRMLRYIFSRGGELKPSTNRMSKIGYDYPFIQSHLQMSHDNQLVDFLGRAEKDGLLHSTLVDHVHSCHSCDSTYLHYRECCPECHSIDIRSEDIIHHFVCAHVAPESDFKKDDHLECPKCDKELRHIGIDYDKPSSMYFCNQCGNKFQNPVMDAFCVDCHTHSRLDELISRKINSFTLSSTGERIAIWGLESEVSEKAKSFPSFCDQSFFNFLFEREKKISGHSDKFVVKISIEASKIPAFSYDRFNQLQNDIKHIIPNYLDVSDVFSLINQEFYLLYPGNIKEDELMKKLEDLHFNLTKLVNHNLNAKEDAISVVCKKIDSSSKLTELF